jgi:hypothetical protein
VKLFLFGIVVILNSCTSSKSKVGGSIVADSLNAETAELPEFVDLSKYHTTYLYGADFHGIFEFKQIGDTSAGELFQYIEIQTKLHNSERTTSFSMYDYYLTVSNSYKEHVKNNLVQLTNYIIFEPGADGIPKPIVADSLLAPTYNLNFSVKDTLLVSFRYDSPAQPDFYAVFNDKNWVNWIEKSTWKNRDVSMLIMNGNFKFSYKQKNFIFNNDMICGKTYYYAKGIGLVRYSFKCDDGRNNTYELNRIISPKEFQEMQLNPPKPPLPKEDTTPVELMVPLNK